MNFDQGQFDFDAKEGGDETGYRNWQRRLQEEQRAFEKRWGVCLGCHVRLQLRDYANPLEGTIHLDTRQPSAGRQPRLLLGNASFSPKDIEALVKLAPESERHTGSS